MVKCFICGETSGLKKGFFMDKTWFCESCSQYDNPEEAKKNPELVTKLEGKGGFHD